MNGALAGLILVYLIVIVAGKKFRERGPREYLFIVVMTLLQVGVILYFIYTAMPPEQ